MLARSTYSLWSVPGAEYAFNIDPSIPSDTMLQRRSVYCGENSEIGGNRKELDLVSGIREHNRHIAATSIFTKTVSYAIRLNFPTGADGVHFSFLGGKGRYSSRQLVEHLSIYTPETFERQQAKIG